MILPGYSPAQCYGHANLPTGGKVEGGYDNARVLFSAMWRPCRPSHPDNDGKGGWVLL